MTDSTPPSIPPRSRPTSPTGTGRSTTSSPVRPGSNAVWTGDDASAVEVPGALTGTTDSPSSTGATGAASMAGPATVAPRTVPPHARTPTSGGRSAVSSGAPATALPATALPATALPAAGAPPEAEPDPATSPEDGAQDDGPSPMMVAVDTTTAWLKRAGAATTAAFASITHPRPEEPTMTTTPAAPARTSAPLPGGAPENVTGPRPPSGRIPTVAPHGAPRRVRLAISRIDPWSVMKLSLLLSVAIGIMFVVAVTVLWLTLNGMHVFAKVDNLVTQIVGSESSISVKQYVEFKRIVSGATLIAVVDVFLLTALSTIGAFLYNIVAALVGGVHVTMTDE